MGDWLATAHAKAGVNCSACHQTTDDAGKTAWLEHPDHRVCTACHGPEVEGFLSGKHGMRLRQGLPAMRPADARQRMQARAHDKRLGCMSCHMAHRFDTKQAAVEACVGCHDDGHSRAYKASKHYVLWQREVRGEAPAGSGVSCASCHLPRASFDTPDYVSRILVQHNQSDSLRPNEKMIRPACMHCHGLRYSIDALADTGLIRRNFRGGTKTAIKSIDMALEAEARADAERRAAKDS
jgi:formate-dependent nitrite reductase cytochrome c552 subunit